MDGKTSHRPSQAQVAGEWIKAINYPVGIIEIEIEIGIGIGIGIEEI